MGLMKGTLPPTLSAEVSAIEKAMLDAMASCLRKLETNDPAALAALDRWFADRTQAFARTMKDKVAKMRGVLNAQQIELTTTMRGGDPNENASATHYIGGIFGGPSGERVHRMTSPPADAQPTTPPTTKMNISPNFTRLPPRSTGPAAQWVGQDKLETLLHELSHYVHGTADETLNDGSTAYGARGALQLATQNSAKAKNNAENWGFFIEELA